MLAPRGVGISDVLSDILREAEYVRDVEEWDHVLFKENAISGMAGDSIA
jgi:hypothetical protein